MGFRSRSPSPTRIHWPQWMNLITVEESRLRRPTISTVTWACNQCTKPEDRRDSRGIFDAARSRIGPSTNSELSTNSWSKGRGCRNETVTTVWAEIGRGIGSVTLGRIGYSFTRLTSKMKCLNTSVWGPSQNSFGEVPTTGWNGRPYVASMRPNLVSAKFARAAFYTACCSISQWCTIQFTFLIHQQALPINNAPGTRLACEGYEAE